MNTISDERLVDGDGDDDDDDDKLLEGIHIIPDYPSTRLLEVCRSKCIHQLLPLCLPFPLLASYVLSHAHFNRRHDARKRHCL